MSGGPTYPPQLEIRPYAGPPLAATVTVPGSKSITNRALVLAALARLPDDVALTGALRSEDTEVMIDCLRCLGYAIETHWDQPEPLILFLHRPTWPEFTVRSAELFVGNSGTTMRFLTALVATREGRYRLDGVPRMRERPVQDLLDALNQVRGVRAYSEAQNGCPPVVVENAGQASADSITVRSAVSSQFLSGLLMAAPNFASEEWVDVRVPGPLVSEPYIEMTLAMMRTWGQQVERPTPDTYRVAPNSAGLDGGMYAIEPDASAASYFWAAAAVLGGRVTVAGLTRQSLQGDVAFVDVLQEMGCRIETCDAGITVHGRQLRGVDVDMNAISDTVMTLGAVACFAEGPTRIRNVAHIRHKETDRIAALATELRRLGAEVEEMADGLTIIPRPLHGATVQTYNDHRMAMSLALVGLKVPGVVIDNPGCVAKTYPGFWQDLSRWCGGAVVGW